MMARLWRRGLHRPEAVRVIARDLLGHRGPVLDTRVHLEAAAEWLLRAQTATPDDGVACGYSFEDRWVASYPETTGYIIVTLLAYAAYTGNREYEKRSLAMAEWELTLQHKDGGFPGQFVDRPNPAIVFNTGQVMFGLLAAYEHSGDARYLDAASRAGRWLTRIQDEDGAWRRHDYRDT